MRPRSTQMSDRWTRGRTASKRLDVKWSFTGDVPSLKLKDAVIQSHDRNRVSRTIRQKRQEERGDALRQKEHQGRVAQCLKNAPASSHYLLSGEYLSFADWRFVHKARLQLLPLNGCKPWTVGINRSCRRCGYVHEGVAHVLGGCHTHMVLRQKRHDSIIDRIETTAKHRGWKVEGKNTQIVEGSNLRPDLVLSKGTDCKILDITVPFENRQEAFERARKEKEDKYAAIKTALEAKYAKVTISPIIVGALGTWDPLNNKHLRGLTTRAYLEKMVKLVVCETLSWSRCIYMEHLSGRIQRPARWTPPTGTQQQDRPSQRLNDEDEEEMDGPGEERPPAPPAQQPPEPVPSTSRGDPEEWSDVPASTRTYPETVQEEEERTQETSETRGREANRPDDTADPGPKMDPTAPGGESEARREMDHRRPAQKRTRMEAEENFNLRQRPPPKKMAGLHMYFKAPL